MPDPVFHGYQKLIALKKCASSNNKCSLKQWRETELALRATWIPVLGSFDQVTNAVHETHELYKNSNGKQTSQTRPQQPFE